MPSSLPFLINDQNDSKHKSYTKIGKLRLLKSGKVVLRLHEQDSNILNKKIKKYIDLDVSKGI